MSSNPISLLVYRWIHEPGFSQSLRSNMEATVSDLGLTLNERQWQGLRSIDWTLTEWMNFLLLVQLETQTDRSPAQKNLWSQRRSRLRNLSCLEK